MEFRDKKILVTGATGLIGFHLVKELLKEGALVYAMGRSILKLERVFKDVELAENIKLMEGNIAESLKVFSVEFDFIFHAASPISGLEIKEKPVDTISANLQGTINCLEQLKNQKHGRLVVFSSATVYGNFVTEEKSVKEEETEYADALHTGNTPYSESKRMIEVIARAYNKQYSVDAVIVRIGYVYGFIRPYPNTAFYEFINKAIEGNDIVLNNSGMARRDNIHVNDVICGLTTVARKGVAGESYNISSNGDNGNYRAIDEIAKIIAESVNGLKSDGIKSVEAVIKPFDGIRKPGLRLNNEKLKALGWKPEIDLNEGILETVRKYMEN